MQVVGAEDDRGGVIKGEKKGMRISKSSSSPTANISTREDIRKKLASWGEEDEEEEEGVENNNLEICFFNETASDDEEEVTRNPLDEDEDEDYFEEEERSVVRGGGGLPRSKSEGFSLRPDPLLQPESNQLR